MARTTVTRTHTPYLDQLRLEYYKAQTLEAFSDLLAYLEYHESDIAYDINDFGDLKRVFFHLFGHDPEKE